MGEVEGSDMFVVLVEESSSYTRDGRMKSFSKISLPSFRHLKVH